VATKKKGGEVHETVVIQKIVQSVGGDQERFHRSEKTWGEGGPGRTHSSVVAKRNTMVKRGYEGGRSGGGVKSG